MSRSSRQPAARRLSSQLRRRCHVCTPGSGLRFVRFLFQVSLRIPDAAKTVLTINPKNLIVKDGKRPPVRSLVQPVGDPMPR